MGATNTDVYAVELVPLGGATSSGVKIGYLVTGAKAAQNDTLTVKNAKTVHTAFLQISASGADEPNTISANVITLTSATATAVEGLLIYS